MNTFFWGATSMACLAIGLIFFRSWRDTGDRFFALFGWAFWVLALHWTALAVVGATDESQHYFYATRLLGFALVLSAIIEKNRETRR